MDPATCFALGVFTGSTFTVLFAKIAKEGRRLEERPHVPPTIPAASAPVVPPRCLVTLDSGQVVDLNEEVARA